jgi:hypothetical protein
MRPTSKERGSSSTVVGQQSEAPDPSMHGCTVCIAPMGSHSECCSCCLMTQQYSYECMMLNRLFDDDAQGPTPASYKTIACTC